MTPPRPRRRQHRLARGDVRGPADVDRRELGSHFGEIAHLERRLRVAAEARTPDPAALPFDLATNSCLHYAGALSRELGFPEDAALADFIVENLVAHQGGGEAIARLLAEKDPAAVAGSGLHRDIIKKAVYSQMEL